MPRIFGVALLLLGSALLAGGCKGLDLFSGPFTLAKGSRVGYPAPELDGEDFDGKRVKLSDYRGKVVAVVFWASWCSPCRAMIPHERDMVERFRDKPFVLLGVNNDDNHAAARAVIAAEKMTWPICKTNGPKDAINQRWRVEAWPTVYVIDAKGVIRYYGVRGPQLEAAIETLLAEAEPKR
jgi:thiol-disulfide isomerase/thioredoxin